MPNVDWKWVDDAGLNSYVQGMRADIDELRRRLSFTDLLGRVLHWERLGQLRAKIDAIGPRMRHSQLLGELELTFLQNPDWVEPTDRYLRVLRADLLGRQLPSLYRHFERQLALDPVPRLAELNIYGAAAQSLPVEAFPLTGVGKRRSDMAIQVDGRSVFVEVTALMASDASREEWDAMNRMGLSHFVGSGRADADVGRLVGKAAHELRQVAPGHANVIVILQHEPNCPFDAWYTAATEEGFSGDFAAMDPSHQARLAHLDSIVLCGRHHVRAVCVNATAVAESALTETQRAGLIHAFRLADVMMR